MQPPLMVITLIEVLNGFLMALPDMIFQSRVHDPMIVLISNLEIFISSLTSLLAFLMFFWCSPVVVALHQNPPPPRPPPLPAVHKHLCIYVKVLEPLISYTSWNIIWSWEQLTWITLKSLWGENTSSSHRHLTRMSALSQRSGRRWIVEKIQTSCF